jgi:hypothetical protein
MRQLQQRFSVGPDMSGERRQEQLSTYINLFLASGKGVDINGITLTDNPDSPFWSLTRDYVLYDGAGAAMIVDGPSIQSITRESRTDSFVGLPVGEADLQCAAIECLIRRLQRMVVPNEMGNIIAALNRIKDHSPEWRHGPGVQKKGSKQKGTELSNRGDGFFGT